MGLAGGSVRQPYLQLVLEQVLLVGKLAVQAEELLLVCRHFLCVHVRSCLSKLFLCLRGRSLGDSGGA
jgi:hypothetical protein